MKLNTLIEELQEAKVFLGGDVQVIAVQKSPGGGTNERVARDKFTHTGTPCVSIVLEDKEIT